MTEIFRLQHFRRREQLHRAETELGVFTTALRPFARALAQQPRANADQGLDAQLTRRELGDLIAFLQSLR